MKKRSEKNVEIFVVMNKKGGVGKTTTSLALAADLQCRGYNVLAIDLDAQCNFTSTMRINPDSVKAGAYNLLAKTADINDTIQETNFFDVIPGQRCLNRVDVEITDVGKEYRLKEALENLKKTYDYLIIDTPPAIGLATTNALTIADKVIIVAQADTYSLDGLMQLYNSIETIKKYCNQSLKIDGILLTRYNSRTLLSKEVRRSFNNIAVRINSRVYESYIHENIALKEAQAYKTTIFAYDKHSNGAIDYHNFVNEFLNIKEGDDDGEEKGFFDD